MIRGEGISFFYDFDGEAVPALREVSLKIAPGEFVAILGANGSGKSTLARHINALLPLQNGSLWVSGVDAGDKKSVWQLRRRCGMVFQNPENQFVSSVLEEDIAFGLENYGTPWGEIPEKVREALKQVSMEDYALRSPHTLSGGQKQRAALAGVLALSPDILVFDEATAMLDPEGRGEVLEIIHRLHQAGKTVLMITHYPEEAATADRVLLMREGRIFAEGTPKEILTDPALLREAHLTPPVPVQLYYDLKAAGLTLPDCPLTNEEFAQLCCLI